jgi:hypothetical protein
MLPSVMLAAALKHFTLGKTLEDVSLHLAPPANSAGMRLEKPGEPKVSLSWVYARASHIAH